MKKLKITVEDAKATLRDVATGPDSQNWRYSPAVKALLNNHDELLVILGEAKVALEEKDQRIKELEDGAALDQYRIKTLEALADQNDKQRDHWMERANAAEQRLQQPIKLPLAEGESKQEYLDKVIEVLNGAGLQIRYHCPRCNGLLDLTSRPDGDHYCHQQAKVEGE